MSGPRPLNPETIVPDDCSWQRLLTPTAMNWKGTYRSILQTLARQPGMLV